MSREQNKGLFEALTNCAAECNHCATACLDEEDVKMLARCIKLDIVVQKYAVSQLYSYQEDQNSQNIYYMTVLIYAMSVPRNAKA
jgi:hypothetical protein